MTRHSPVPAAPTGASRPRPFFRTPHDIVIGMVVFDLDHEMPGTVRNLDGRWVDLQRPTGLIWRVNFSRLRRGTEREARQLIALAKLQRARERGRCS
ncbi:hypothetical protein AB0O01_17375 [Streptomyces sp. NPDC093252]|uniref:hypothetical protein n=1 Tax=Streptomyces sp. NPDC093252 TaxID=3154980 RepID=UPI00341DD307